MLDSYQQLNLCCEQDPVWPLINLELVNSTTDGNFAQHAVIQKEGLAQCCNFQLLLKLVNQLLISVPFLLRCPKSWCLLGVKLSRRKAGICLLTRQTLLALS